MSFLKFILSLIIISTLVNCSQVQKEEEIKHETIAGVPHISNPARPKYGTIDLQLQEEFAIKPEEIGDDQYMDIEIYSHDPDGNLYLIDNKSLCIRKFNPEGKALSTFRFSKGEGPGEFQFIAGFHPLKDGFWLDNFRGKIARFDLQGRYLEEKRFTTNRMIDLKVIPGSKLLLLQNLYLKVTGKRDPELDALPMKQKFVMLDLQGKELQVFIESTRTGDWVNNVIRFSDERITPHIKYDFCPDRRIVAFAVSDRYEIFEKNLRGKTVKVIKRQHPQTKISASHLQVVYEEPFHKKLINLLKTRFNKDLKHMIRKNLKSEYLCIIKGIHYMKNGYLWVSRFVDFKANKELDVFDPRGEFIYTFRLPEKIAELRDAGFHNHRLVGLAVDREKQELFYVQYKFTNLPKFQN